MSTLMVTLPQGIKAMKESHVYIPTADSIVTHIIQIMQREKEKEIVL